ncbi:xylose isomerase [Octopus bimaculoides]|uniref:Xylose isomerase n=1 Tax=Octopus bimaculoides TaxID=37653 RepID=A0A0L8H1I1_OCTBM|nr:xylose isomerase [Octopus bimaculoides]|eukprot:XP_014776218.1 PREDICTED: xylose isomerase-like [Octopus bimaculoides]
MSSFAPTSTDKKSISSESYDKPDAVFFSGIEKIPFQPDAGPAETLVFKHYNPTKIVYGKTMEEWLRFSVCFWHTFRGTGADPFGFPTLFRPWDDNSNTIANAKRRLRAAFEFFSKLGVKHWCFHDRDIAPEGSNLEETNKNLDELTDLAQELQQKTGVKLLWATCNLFAHPRYMTGASTSPNAHVFAFAAAQVKKGLEIAKKLGAENFVFWGGREGFQTLLNTNILAELTHMANFFKMAVAYKEKIGLKCQFLLEPKPKEPTSHQYDYDAMTVIAFLKHFGLEKHFKLNIEPNHTTLAGHCYDHDVAMASSFGMLGSVDSNTGSPELGWDTDEFPMDVKNTTFVMKTVLQQGGLQPGGLNFDCKVRRESTHLNDMFISHIGAMDTFAQGLLVAAKILTDGVIPAAVKERYSSFNSGIGKKITDGNTSFEELEEYIMSHGEPTVSSGQQEHYQSMVNHYLKIQQ